jgi:hypothetical protein
MFGHSGYVQCHGCGVVVEDVADHVCDRERMVDHQMARLGDELANLEEEINAYLSSPRGRFDAWWATRERRCRS